MSLKDLLGLGSESDTNRDGPLSSYREWHSFALGGTIGFISALNVGFEKGAWLLLIFAGLAYSVQRMDTGPLADLRKEPQYALVAATLAFLATSFLVIPYLPDAI
jgi:hypothetical protein